MRAGGRRRVLWHGGVLCLGLLISLLIGACSQPRSEPGLFGRQPPVRAPTVSAAPGPSGSGADGGRGVDPDLPVLGERIWVSGDGTASPFRIALHGLRRMAGGTVLDWSITPLPRAGLEPGTQLQDTVGVGPAGDPLAFRLIDTARGQVYGPLTGRDGNDCLCTVPGTRLQAGQTLVQQLLFPALPADLHAVAVDIPSVALFTGVPLPDRGQVVRAVHRVDLARPPDVDEVSRWTPAFTYGPTGQRFRLGIISVDASSDTTSVVWSIESLSAGPGLEARGAMPITAAVDGAAGRSVASGLRLAVSAAGRVRAGRPVGVWRAQIGAGRSAGDCLCTELRGWTGGMVRAGRSVTVVSNVPALPLQADRVDAVFAGLARLDRIAVRRPGGAESAYTGYLPDGSRHWSSTAPYEILGWPVDAWPTPRPDASIVRFFDVSVSRLR